MFVVFFLAFRNESPIVHKHRGLAHSSESLRGIVLRANLLGFLTLHSEIKTNFQVLQSTVFRREFYEKFSVSSAYFTRKKNKNKQKKRSNKSKAAHFSRLLADCCYMLSPCSIASFS